MINTSREDMMNANLKNFSNFHMTVKDKQEDLPLMY